MSATPTKQPLVLNFKEDSLATVSRDTLRAVAKRLGFNETQTVLFALARLRDEVLVTTHEELMPLTKQQEEAITKAAPKGKGKVLDSLRA
jgi:hypothetical protein